MHEKVTAASELSLGEHQLKEYSSTPRLDSELLLCEALGWTREKLLISLRESVPEEAGTRFRAFLSRRINGEPVAYILGRRDFWKHTFLVDRSVLIPRPETELLVERALEVMEKCPDENPIIVDLGTGSGCIACSIAHEFLVRNRSARVVAVDRSPEALETAKKNAARMGVGGRIEFRHGSWFEPLAGLEGSINLVLSNPPYVRTGDDRMSRECALEPAHALYAGPEGLSDIETLVTAFPRFGKAGSIMIFEFGMGQEAAIEKMIPPGIAVRFHKDLSGIIRAAELRL